MNDEEALHRSWIAAEIFNSSAQRNDHRLIAVANIIFLFSGQN